jgi:hypothetical protein
MDLLDFPVEIISLIDQYRCPSPFTASECEQRRFCGISSGFLEMPDNFAGRSTTTLVREGEQATSRGFSAAQKLFRSSHFWVLFFGEVENGCLH